MERKEYKIVLDNLTNSKPLAVLNVGSLVRGNFDDLSDFDFILIWNDLANNPWPEGACRINGQKCGIRNVTFNSLQNKEWSQLERHAYSFATTESDPQNLAGPLMKEKCVWRKNERLDIFCEQLFRLSYVVNLTDNYKSCWNEREELAMAIARGQMLNCQYLAIDFIHSLIELAIITDKAFIPSHKTCFSEWIKNISPRAYEIYQISMNNLNVVQNPEVEMLKKIYKPHIERIIQVFETEDPLPENIMEYRNKIVRLSKA